MTKPTCLERPFDGYYFSFSSKVEKLPEENLDSEEIEQVEVIKNDVDISQLCFEEALPQKRAEKLNTILGNPIFLENHTHKGFDLTINLITFWQKLALEFKNQPFLIGSFVGHLYDPMQIYNDIDYVNPITKVIVVSSLDPSMIQEEIQKSVKKLADEVRNTIEDILIDFYQQTYPIQPIPSRHEIWAMFFGKSTLINMPVDLEFNSFGSRFSLLRLGILEIKTVFDCIIFPLGKEPITINGMEKPCAFSKDGLRVTLSGLLKDGIATSANTNIISIAGPIRDAVNCLNVRELTTSDPDGGKFVKWLDYVTLRKYICSPTLALEIFANCLNQFPPEVLLGRFERYTESIRAKSSIGVLSCLLNTVTLCDSLLASSLYCKLHEKALLLKDEINECARGYLSIKSQGYLNLHPELKEFYVDFCKVLLFVVPTVKPSKSEGLKTFRKLISYEEQTYSLITLANPLKLFTKFIRQWKESPYSLFELYRGILRQVRLKGDIPTDDKTCLALFVSSMYNFFSQGKDFKSLVLFNHFMFCTFPEFHKVGMEASIIWHKADFDDLLGAFGIDSLDSLKEEVIEDLLVKASLCNDAIMDYFTIVLSQYITFAKYEFEILKCLPRALGISHDLKLKSMNLDPTLSAGIICTDILKQCSQELKLSLWLYYLDNHLFDSPGQAAAEGFKISISTGCVAEVWNRIASTHEFDAYPTERSLIFIEYIKVLGKTNSNALAEYIVEHPIYIKEAYKNDAMHSSIDQFIDDLIEKAKTIEEFQLIANLISPQPNQQVCVKFLSALISSAFDNQITFQVGKDLFEFFIKNGESLDDDFSQIIVDFLIITQNHSDLLQKVLTIIVKSGIPSVNFNDKVNEYFCRSVNIIFLDKNFSFIKTNLAFFDECLEWISDEKTKISLIQRYSMKLLEVDGEGILTEVAYNLVNRYSEDQLSPPVILSLVCTLIQKACHIFTKENPQERSIAKTYEFFYKALHKLSNLCRKFDISEFERDKEVINVCIRKIVALWDCLPSKVVNVENTTLILELIEKFESKSLRGFIFLGLLSPCKEVLPIVLNKLDDLPKDTAFRDGFFQTLFKDPKLSLFNALEILDYFCKKSFVLTNHTFIDAYYRVLKKINKSDVATFKRFQDQINRYPYNIGFTIIKKIGAVDPDELISSAKYMNVAEASNDMFYFYVFQAFVELYLEKSELVTLAKFVTFFKSYNKFFDLQSLPLKSAPTILKLYARLDKIEHSKLLGAHFVKFREFAFRVIQIIFNNTAFIGEKRLIEFTDALEELIFLKSKVLEMKGFTEMYSYLAAYSCHYTPDRFFSSLLAIEELMKQKNSGSYFCKEYFLFVEGFNQVALKKVSVPFSIILTLINKINCSFTEKLVRDELDLLYMEVRVLMEILLTFNYPECFEDFFALLNKAALTLIKRKIVCVYFEIAQHTSIRKNQVNTTLTILKHLAKIAPEDERIADIKRKLVITMQS